jgi:hypothetical protein
MCEGYPADDEGFPTLPAGVLGDALNTINVISQPPLPRLSSPWAESASFDARFAKGHLTSHSRHQTWRG